MLDKHRQWVDDTDLAGPSVEKARQPKGVNQAKQRISEEVREGHANEHESSRAERERTL